MIRFGVFCLLIGATVSVKGSTMLELDCQSTLMNITPSVASVSSTVSCPLFDGSLGTLVGATFLGHPVIDSGTITLRNNTDSTIPNPIVMLANMQFEHLPGAIVYELMPRVPVTVGLDLLAGQTTTFLVQRLGYGEVAEQLPVADALIASPGATEFDVPVSITTSLIQEGLSGAVSVLDYSLNVWPGNANDSDPSLVVYTYDPASPIPEPATWPLVGSGLTAAWLCQHLRSKRAVS